MKARLRELAPFPLVRRPYHASYLAFPSSGMPWIGRSVREMGVILLLTWVTSRRVLFMSDSESAQDSRSEKQLLTGKSGNDAIK